MSSISSVSAPSAPIPITDAKPIKVAVPASGGAATGAASTAAQEATETPDVTRKEAAKGDKQAVKLLAKEAAQQQGGTSGLSIKA